MKRIASIAPFIFALFLPLASHAATISIYPDAIIQGDPVIISIIGTSTVKSISFGGQKLPVTIYNGKPTAFYGFDLNKKTGVFKISAILSDNTLLEKNILVDRREKAVVSFTIPLKLGGNTKASQTKLVSTLSDENAGLLGLKTGVKAFWSEPFIFPVKDATTTDTYGYSRDTGSVTVAHKGTDFRAAEGTSVMAINNGIVRLTRETRNYGKTIVIDHGQGIMSLYMHLSKIYVVPGEYVIQGQVIGLSGKTGYAESPHIHLSLRIKDISIDPEVFLGYFRNATSSYSFP